MTDWMSSTLAPGATAPAVASNSGLASLRGGVPAGRSRIWAGGFGSWAKQSSADNLPGYKYDSHGLALGYEYARGCLTLGFAGAYSRGDLRIDDLRYKGDADVMNLAAYGTYVHESGAYVQAGLGYGHAWNDYSMSMLAGGRKEGKFGTDDYSADLELGYMAALPKNFMIIPSVGLEYDYLHNGGWTERVSGTPLPFANRFASGHDDGLAIPLGLRVNRSFLFGNGCYVTPELRGAFVYRAIRSRPSIDAGFAGMPGSANMAGVEPGRTYWRLGAGLAGRLGDRVDFRVDYDFDTRSGFHEHNVSASLGVGF